MEYDWEHELAAFLTELSAAQKELLQLLAEKRDLLAAADLDGMAAIQGREQHLHLRLQACHDRRRELLDLAVRQGLPSDSLQSLNASLPRAQRGQLGGRIREAASRSRLLQHQCLTNWVLAQRTLLHLAQILEIIATGGRPCPTYGSGEPLNCTGSLVDQAV
jgi:hypothetical protein